MRSAGSDVARRAEDAGNRVAVPFAWNLRLGEFVRQTAARASKDQLPVFAGNLAFRALFAIFPSLITLFWLLALFRAEGLVNSLLDLVATAMPEAAAEPLRNQLSSVPQAQATGTVTAGAVLCALIALWALSSTFRAAMTALNTVYAVEDRRPLWRRYVLSLCFSLTVTLLLVGALLLVVFGKAIATWSADLTGFGIGFRWAWAIVSWPVLAALVLSACALIYYFAPDCEQRFRWISTGAVVAVVLWILFTVVFSFYINRLADYSAVYGALAGIAVLMIYVYGSAFILLLGAEMNQVIGQRDPEGKDPGDRVPGG
jgi:membrane protein